MPRRTHYYVWVRLTISYSGVTITPPVSSNQKYNAQ